MSVRSFHTSNDAVSICSIIHVGEFYSVEAIVDRQQGPDGYCYFVKWEGYDAAENTWEPRDALRGEGVWELVQQFDRLRHIGVSNHPQPSSSLAQNDSAISDSHSNGLLPVDAVNTSQTLSTVNPSLPS